MSQGARKAMRICSRMNGISHGAMNGGVRIYFNLFEESTMPAIRVKENEPFDVALRRFKRSCEKAGVLTEIRKREAYEKPTTERKRKAAAAVKRHLKKLSKERNKFSRSPHQRRR